MSGYHHLPRRRFVKPTLPKSDSVGRTIDGALQHVPVMRQEVIAVLCPSRRQVFLDCTVGLGGHAEALLAQAPPDSRLIGLDVDQDNLDRAAERLSRFAPRVKLQRANFAEAKQVLNQTGAPAADAVLADLGLASTQLGDDRRGFSFSVDGPLDMRLDDRLKKTAADLVNRLGEVELADLIYTNGEERYSRRIAGRIVSARRAKRIERTVELASIVAGAYPRATRRSRRGVHPATRTFQALRIAVNDELGSLETLLRDLPDLLAAGGRACIISFHSLEDRRVKHAFAAMANEGRAKLMTKKPLVPTAQELAKNPRSRSAKLRGLERIEQAMD